MTHTLILAHEDYRIFLEDLEQVYDEIEHLCQMHYEELRKTMTARGLTLSDYNPRKDYYRQMIRRDQILNYVVRYPTTPVGYAHVFLSPDIHNGDLTALVDAVYIKPDYRTGIGRSLVKEIIEDLRTLKVKRVSIATSTDDRTAILWKRMGFRHVADHLTLET